MNSAGLLRNKKRSILLVFFSSFLFGICPKRRRYILERESRRPKKEERPQQYVGKKPSLMACLADGQWYCITIVYKGFFVVYTLLYRNSRRLTDKQKMGIHPTLCSHEEDLSRKVPGTPSRDARQQASSVERRQWGVSCANTMMTSSIGHLSSIAHPFLLRRPLCFPTQYALHTTTTTTCG